MNNWLTGQNLAQVFNSRCGMLVYSKVVLVYQQNSLFLKLKTLRNSFIFYIIPHLLSIPDDVYIIRRTSFTQTFGTKFTRFGMFVKSTESYLNYLIASNLTIFFLLNL